MRFAQEGDFIEGDFIVFFAVFVCCGHLQRADFEFFGVFYAFDQIGTAVVMVEQEAECALIDAEYWCVEVFVIVEGAEHCAVAADNDDNVCFAWGNGFVFAFKLF